MKSKKIELTKLKEGDLVFYNPVKNFSFINFDDYIASKIIEIVSPKKIHVGPIINDPAIEGFIEVFSSERKAVKPTVLDLSKCYDFKRIKGSNETTIKNSINKNFKKFGGKRYGYGTAFLAGFLRVFGLKTLYKRVKAPTCSYQSSEFICDVLGLDKFHGMNTHDVLPDDIYKSELLESIE